MERAPTWSYVPPAAMASSDTRTMSSDSGAWLRTKVRSRKSSVIACGNFGAGPNPPNCGSYWDRTDS